ncbi:unnamed protein product [Symbiodinium sp. CCMP2456]|nr:unnamed protein product [Symbiodinium sp. CCMP2456]
MQFRLTCQRTFIHAEGLEDEDVSTCQRRTQSAPPEDRSTERSTYVSALASRADQLHFWLRKRGERHTKEEKDEKESQAESESEQNSGDVSTRAGDSSSSRTSNASKSFSSLFSHSPSAASESQSEPETFQAEFSLGSLGHPEVCHRPCVNFAKGFCAAGSSCDYCHLSHVETPLVTANKELRVILQQATEFDLLSIAVKHAWTRAADKGFLEKAKEAKVLTLLEERLQALVTLETDSTSSLSQKHQGKLDRFMAKMPFSGLMGLALRKSQDGSHTAMVKAAVDSLRSNLSQ